MGKVFLSITMSLDGFIAREVITQENPMGSNGQSLHKWLFANKEKGDEEVASEMFSNCGAVILGSKTYTSAINGVWESKSRFPVQAFVLTSQKMNVTKGFTLVNVGLQNALSMAKSIVKKRIFWLWVEPKQLSIFYKLTYWMKYV